MSSASSLIQIAMMSFQSATDCLRAPKAQTKWMFAHPQKLTASKLRKSAAYPTCAPNSPWLVGRFRRVLPGRPKSMSAATTPSATQKLCVTPPFFAKNSSLHATRFRCAHVGRFKCPNVGQTLPASNNQSAARRSFASVTSQSAWDCPAVKWATSKPICARPTWTAKNRRPAAKRFSACQTRTPSLVMRSQFARTERWVGRNARWI